MNSKNKRVLLVLDQAGWHTTDKLELPEGLDWYFLFPISYKLNTLAFELGSGRHNEPNSLDSHVDFCKRSNKNQKLILDFLQKSEGKNNRHL